MRSLGLWLFTLIVVSGCSFVPPPGQLEAPECLDGGACVEGFLYDGRVYGLICTGVKPDAVAATVVANGQGVYEEARPIDGLATTHWLAVRGAQIPCQPAVGEPLEHEWYLALSDQASMSVADQDVLQQVTLP